MATKGMAALWSVVLVRVAVAMTSAGIGAGNSCTFVPHEQAVSRRLDGGLDVA